MSLTPLSLVKVAFPYIKRPLTQSRPALVVSSYQHDGTPHLLWLMMITSQTNKPWPDDIEIVNYAVAGLTKPCVVRPSKIATLQARDATYIGTLADEDRVAVSSVLRGYLSQILLPPH